MTFLAPYPVSEKVDTFSLSVPKAVFGGLVYFYFVYIYFYLLFFLCNGSFHDRGQGFIYTLFPTSIDFGNPNSLYSMGKAGRVIFDLFMLTVWALHHSIFARGPFKRYQIETLGIPADLERSVYVLTTTAMVHLIFNWWQPVEDIIWGNFDTSEWNYFGILIGWLITFASTFMIDHFDLFGIRRAAHMYKDDGKMKEVLFYKWIRHPLMTGFFIQFWVRPYMTAASLIWGLATTGYILLATMVEERDLAIMIPAYANYRQRTGAFLPMCPMWNPLIQPAEITL